MAYEYNDGIGFGDDQYFAQPGTVPSLIKNFRQKKVIRPEDLGRAEQYGISLNAPCTNTRNSFITAEDRYGMQTQFDLDNGAMNGTSYALDNPAMMFKKPRGHYDDVVTSGSCGSAYDGKMGCGKRRNNCMKGRNFYNEGIDPVPNLDEYARSKWQPCQDGWGGVYPMQERFTSPLFASSISGENLLMLLFIFILVIAVLYNIMKTHQLCALIKLKNST